MKRIISILALLGVSMAFAAGLSAQQPSREQMEAMIAQMPKIPNSDQLRIGRLDNGLTYYIRHNELPAGRAEFYLATNVGAIQEEYPSQDGLAHFLEHMCFNGTEHFPDKAILDYLRSIGAEFGRNINASTGFEETQYMLNNIPVERESVVDSCLMILCDYSHFVLNDPVEVDKERGVIVEERRQRRTAQWRSMERSLPLYFGDTKMSYTTLIGLQEHLLSFDPQALVDFYHTWYHPDMQAVVVVGDIDVDRTEQKIQEIFGVIPACENPRQKAILELADHDEPRVGVITDPETVSPSVEILWHSPANPESINATIVGQLSDIAEYLIGMIMDERFSDITSDPSSLFLSGGFGVSSLIYEDIDAAYGSVTLKEDHILDGFKAFYTELVRMARYGFTDAEFERAKAEYISYIESAANKADTRRNAEFIRPILSNFFDQQPILEPQDELDMTNLIFDQVLTAQVVNQLAMQLITPNNLVVVYDGPEKDGIATPTEAQLLAIIEEVNASQIDAPAGEDIPDALLDPSTLRGSKIRKTGSTIYGATTWVLKNGLTVVVYPTDLTRDQIIFDLYKDGGESLISTDDIATFDSSIFSQYVSNTGVAGFSGTTLSKMLTGKNVRVTPYINSLEHGIRGNSTVRDLETALQLMYLYFTQPRFDSQEWDNGIQAISSYLPNLMTNPNYRMQQELFNTLWGNNARRQVISGETLDRASLQVLESNYRRLFNDAAGATLVIVGDVNLDVLKPLVQKYAGSLPKGRHPLNWVNTHEDIVPGCIENVFGVDMQTPKSTVLQVYSADVEYSAERVAAYDAISYILDMRYTESLREDEGGTYGASTSASLRRRPTPMAIIETYFDCRPSVCDRLRQLAIEGITDLAENGPTDEEVQMAILNLRKNIPERRLQNNYWMNAIESYLLYQQDSDAAREAAIDSLTKEFIQQCLQEVLAQNNFKEIVMIPANTGEGE